MSWNGTIDEMMTNREGAALSAPMAAPTREGAALSAPKAAHTREGAALSAPSLAAADFTQRGGVGDVSGARGVESEDDRGVESGAENLVKSSDSVETSRLQPPAPKGVESGGGVGISFREEILLLLAEKPLGSTEVARKFGYRRVFGNLVRRITTLLDDKLIELTIPEKPKSRLQKYRITKKGLEIAKRLASLRGAHGGAPSHAHQCR